MKKFLLLPLILLLGSGIALADQRDLSFKSLDELSILSASSIDGTADYQIILDASAGGQPVRVLASGPAFVSGITATAAEINRSDKVSTRIVNLATDTTLTEALHEGKTLVMGGAGSSRTFTLPAATGGGGMYKFFVGAVNTSNYVITHAGSDIIKGTLVFSGDNASNALTSFETQTAVTITLNGTTKGGAGIGDFLYLEDCAAATWCLRGQVTESGSEITPFS